MQFLIRENQARVQPPYSLRVPSVIDDPAPDGVEQITQIRCRDIVVRPQVLGKKIAFGYPCFAFAPRFIRKENCQ